MVNMVPYEAFACPCGAGDVVLRESYKPKPVVNYTMNVYDQSLAKTLSDVNSFIERGTSPSTGSSTPPRYSLGASTPQSYSLGTSRNAECSNCKHLLNKIAVLEATVDMYMHPEQHTVNSAALFHEVYNNMGKLDLELTMEDEKEDEDIMQGILVKVGLILKEKRNLHILISHSLCYKEVGAIFVPSNSSSYQTVSCRTSGCLALTESQRSCDSKNMCHYKMGYEDRTHTTGDLAVDAFWFGTTFQYVVFGCGHDNIGHFDKECSGIIGLGVRIICTGPNVVSTPLVKKDPSTFYYLTLESVLVGQNNVSSNKSFSKKDVQEGNIIIDSGTTLTFIDCDLYEELTSGLTEVLGSPTAQDPHGFLEFCYDTWTPSQQ
ncbi:eukaryotic aspartyl protease family protein [Tanacetum coccineum]